MRFFGVFLEFVEAAMRDRSCERGEKKSGDGDITVELQGDREGKFGCHLELPDGVPVFSTMPYQPLQSSGPSQGKEMFLKSEISLDPNSVYRPGVRIIRMRELVRRLSISRSGIYDRLNPRSPRFDATFPRPVRLSMARRGAIGWPEVWIDGWVRARQAA